MSVNVSAGISSMDMKENTEKYSVVSFLVLVVLFIDFFFTRDFICCCFDYQPNLRNLDELSVKYW